MESSETMTMQNTKSTEVHERRHRVRLDRHELSRLVGSSMCASLGISPTRAGVTINVSFEDAREGSPEFKVGTKATVEIVEDLAPQEASPAASPPGGQIFAR